MSVQLTLPQLLMLLWYNGIIFVLYSRKLTLILIMVIVIVVVGVNAGGVVKNMLN